MGGGRGSGMGGGVEGAGSGAEDGRAGAAEERETAELSGEEVKLMELYRATPYRESVRALVAEVAEVEKGIQALVGHEDSDTGLAHPSQWNLAADMAAMQLEKPLQVATLCAKLNQERLMISLRQGQKMVVEVKQRSGLRASELKAGSRLGVEPGSYEVVLKLPPRIDSTVALMEVDERPDVSYADIGGQASALGQLREVLETAILRPERLRQLGVSPPRGVLLYGPPGTGKTLAARAVANETHSSFICVIASQLVQRYVGEGARLVREIFQLARSKKSAVLFIDEIDAIGGARFDDGAGGDSEVQRTMLELIAQMDGFDDRGSVYLLMATNRPDTLDPALTRPGRMDRRVHFDIPDAAGRAEVLRLAARGMKVVGRVRWELLARLAPSASPAELRSLVNAAGLNAIRRKRRSATEEDFLTALHTHTANQRFSATPSYLSHN